MTSFRFLHAADLHLDSPLRGLSRYEGAPTEQLRGATREAFRQLIQLAITERVDLVVLAGDLYDGDWKDYNTGLFFYGQLGELTRAGIRVVLLHGNHDAANRMTKSLTPPDGVTVFGTRKAETARFDDLGVALHGQSFATEKIEKDLAAGYPEPVPGVVNIGVLHTALEGDAHHARYAPCSVADLESKGYDYWALGHVHERRIVSREPWIVFPGNLQGRHARETGAKGCLIVDVADGVVREPTFHALDVTRWARVTVDAGGCEALDQLLGRVREALEAAHAEAEGRMLAARITIEGTTALHSALSADSEAFQQEVRNVGSNVSTALWIEKIRLETEVVTDSADPAESTTGLEELLPGLIGQAADSLDSDSDLLAAAEEAFATLRAALPAEVRSELDADGASTTLRASRDLLVGRLLGTSEGPQP